MQWHIFCRVIDNYGDAGVCWRLAQQLAGPHDQQVVLWLDHLPTLQALCPTALEPERTGIQVRQWQEPLGDLTELELADVVIEAFACELPPAVLERMRQRTQPPQWLNLEYLSAEDWVEGVHGLPSPVHGMTKHFFCPGFTAATGGLLCDQALLQLPAQMNRARARATLLHELGLDPLHAALPLHISLFAYENPQLPGLLDSLADRPCHLLVPAGRISAELEHWLDQPLPVGCSTQRGELRVSSLPFMTQTQYDRLLASCQLNLVRGEESFVRAQMLGLPMLWQAYPQDDLAHLNKMHAFARLYLADMPQALADYLGQAFLAWNNPAACPPDWAALWQQLESWQTHAKNWQNSLLANGDLASNLMRWANAHSPVAKA